MTKSSIKPREIILYGGTGQSKVVRPIIEFYRHKVISIFDDTPNLKPPFNDIPLFQGLPDIISGSYSKIPSNIGFVICIGNTHGQVRVKLNTKLTGMGFKPESVIQSSAIIAKNSILGDGIQVMAGAIIMPYVKIGLQYIINTKASIDHESIIEEGCKVSPGATLCGSVHMQKYSWIEAGATILPFTNIGINATIGKGSVINKNVNSIITVISNPATQVLKK